MTDTTRQNPKSTWLESKIEEDAIRIANERLEKLKTVDPRYMPTKRQHLKAWTVRSINELIGNNYNISRSIRGFIKGKEYDQCNIPNSSNGKLHVNNILYVEGIHRLFSENSESLSCFWKYFGYDPKTYKITKRIIDNSNITISCLSTFAFPDMKVMYQSQNDDNSIIVDIYIPSCNVIVHHCELTSEELAQFSTRPKVIVCDILSFTNEMQQSCLTWNLLRNILSHVKITPKNE